MEKEKIKESDNKKAPEKIEKPEENLVAAEQFIMEDTFVGLRFETASAIYNTEELANLVFRCYEYAQQVRAKNLNKKPKSYYG